MEWTFWCLASCSVHESCLHFSARRAAKEAREAPAQPAPEKARVDIKKFVKIGRPGYKVTKQRDPETGQQSLLFQVGSQGMLFADILWSRLG